MCRFFAIHNWGLNRPDIILSITGGAKAFDLNSDEKDKILKVMLLQLLMQGPQTQERRSCANISQGIHDPQQGMMEGTRGLQPWIITGGTHTGIMKYVGEARARSALSLDSSPPACAFI